MVLFLNTVFVGSVALLTTKCKIFICIVFVSICVLYLHPCVYCIGTHVCIALVLICVLYLYPYVYCIGTHMCITSFNLYIMNINLCLNFYLQIYFPYLGSTFISSILFHLFHAIPSRLDCLYYST